MSIGSSKNHTFKFENWWLGVKGFKDKVESWWSSFLVSGRPCYILATKLKLLKVKLKEWSKENTGNWRRLKKGDILTQLNNLETIQEQRMLIDDELVQKAHLAMEFEEVAKREEITWRQRSRIQWLKNGYKKTNFFKEWPQHIRGTTL